MKKTASKNIILPITVPTDLRDKFKQATEENYTTMSQAVRDFIVDYVKGHPFPEPNVIEKMPERKPPKSRIKKPTTPPAEE